MPLFRRALAFPLLAALAACATTQAPPPAPTASAAQAPRKPITLLVSIDGFRPTSLHQGRTENLDALAADGISGTMQPVFPANTFPNHLSIITGRLPDGHGIVDNAMRDPDAPGVTWKISDAKVNRDPFWWKEALPLWVSAERAGIRTATMFWPGSDAAIEGTRPSAWFPYDAAVTSAQRVDTVLDWARRPDENRPQLIILYFDVVDKASHNEGYDSEKERAAIADVDAQVGRLRAGLKAMGQPVNLVIVSDHGMAPVPPEHVRPLSDVVDPAIMESIVMGPWLDIYPLPGKEAETARALAGKRDNIQCWPRDAIPARYRYGRNPRVAPFVCMAAVGWTFVDKPRAYIKGEHGFEPSDPSMRALFLADGPAFNRTFKPADGFRNVDLYPVLARLVGIAPAPNDGDPATLEGLLATP